MAANFASDNVSGAAPEIVAALAVAADGDAMPYGADDWTARIEAKFKLNQNRTTLDRAGVIAALADSPRENDRDVAALMAAREEG